MAYVICPVRAVTDKRLSAFDLRLLLLTSKYFDISKKIKLTWKQMAYVAEKLDVNPNEVAQGYKRLHGYGYFGECTVDVRDGRVATQKSVDEKIIDSVLEMCSTVWRRDFARNIKGKVGSEEARKTIRARIKEGYTGNDFIIAAYWVARDWPEKYHHPQNAFRPKNIGRAVDNGCNWIKKMVATGTFRNTEKIHGALCPEEVPRSMFRAYMEKKNKNK